MTGEDGKNYRGIVSKRWKEIKEDPAKLSANNDRTRQMKNEAEKPTKLGDDSSVSSTEQCEKMMVARSAVKKSLQRQPQKAPKTPEFVDTDSDDSGTENEEEPALRQSQKAPKTLEFWIQTDDSDNEEEEPHPQKTSPGPLHRELTKPAKKLSAASRNLVTSCTYILTSGIRKGKQCRLKASDKTGNFAIVTKDKHDAEKTDQSNAQVHVHFPGPTRKAWLETMTNLVPPYFSCLLPRYPLHQPYTNLSCNKNS